LPRTSSSALVQLAHGPNHRSYGFGPRENCFEPRRFGYGPRPRCGDHFPHRPGFSVGGSFPHFELRHLDGPCFPYCGSRPTRPSGEVQRTVNDCFTLNDVALVDRLRYNLLSVSQLCDTDLSVLFRKSDSHVLDFSGKRVYGISHIGNIFQADFFSAQSSLKCLISQSSSELWKWHRKLGHLSFDLLCRLSGLGLLRGLSLLKFESDLFCAPCRHGKMIAASHYLVNTVMTEHSRQLLYMDTVGPSRVRSMGGKWYVLVIADDYSRYS
jgi:hypothetical protein